MLTHVLCEIEWEYMWSIASLIMCQHVIKMHVMLKKTFKLHYSCITCKHILHRKCQ